MPRLSWVHQNPFWEKLLRSFTLFTIHCVTFILSLMSTVSASSWRSGISGDGPSVTAVIMWADLVVGLMIIYFNDRRTVRAMWTESGFSAHDLPREWLEAEQTMIPHWEARTPQHCHNWTQFHIRLSHPNRWLTVLIHDSQPHALKSKCLMTEEFVGSVLSPEQEFTYYNMSTGSLQTLPARSD